MRKNHDGVFRPVITSALRLTAASSGIALLYQPQQLGVQVEITFPHQIVDGHWCKIALASIGLAKDAYLGPELFVACISKDEGRLEQPVLLASMSHEQIFNNLNVSSFPNM